MMNDDRAPSALSRRDLFRMIGITAGSAAMYQAMSALGFAADSPYAGPVDLQHAPRGASVLILGAGMAGMTAAYELRNAGYRSNSTAGRAGATGRCAAATGTPNWAGPFRSAYSTRTCTSIRAHGAFRTITGACSTTARCWACRSKHSYR
jgi:hypothetical protein